MANYNGALLNSRMNIEVTVTDGVPPYTIEVSPTEASVGDLYLQAYDPRVGVGSTVFPIVARCAGVDDGSGATTILTSAQTGSYTVTDNNGDQFTGSIQFEPGMGANMSWTSSTASPCTVDNQPFPHGFPICLGPLPQPVPVL